MERVKKTRPTQPAAAGRRRQPSRTGHQNKPVAAWRRDGDRRLFVLENRFTRVTIWPGKGGAIVSHIDRASGLDIIWRNPCGQPPRLHTLDQPTAGGSDLYDVMDGSWYVSLPNGFFAGDYFGAPLGTHGELRAVPWTVTAFRATARAAQVTLEGRSVRTPLVYTRTLTLHHDRPWLEWEETLANRWSEPLPVAWLQHPTFGGPLIEGARLLVPARTVQVYRSDHPAAQQLVAGHRGPWPHVPVTAGGAPRDCRIVTPPGSGCEHAVQLTDFPAGWGCIWNETRQLGFALEWDARLFPWAWSWHCSGGLREYPLWGEGHLITLQPSTSPVGRWPDLLQSGAVLRVPARGAVSTRLRTGFVTQAEGPWAGGVSP